MIALIIALIFLSALCFWLAELYVHATKKI